MGPNAAPCAVFSCCFILTFVITALSACPFDHSDDGSSNEDGRPRHSVASDNSTGVQQPQQPQLCISAGCVETAGSVLANLDTSADPCDDFYQFACGKFMLRNEIPAGQNKLLQFSIVESVIKKQLRTILEAPGPVTESESRKKTRRYYKSCLDLNTIKRNGIVKMRQMVDDFGGLIVNPDDPVPDFNLTALLNRLRKYTDLGPVALYVTADFKNVTRNIILIDQGGLGVGQGSRDYYVKKNILTDPVLVAYSNMLQKFAEIVLNTTGANIDRGIFQDVVRFEQKLAEIQMSNAEHQRIAANYNKVNVSWLQANVGFIDWKNYMNTIFNRINISVDDSEEIILFATSYVGNLTNVMAQYMATKEGKRAVYNYMVLRAIRKHAFNFGGALEAAVNDFKTVSAGQRGSEERWRVCLTNTDDILGFPLGALFIDKYYSRDVKYKATEMIADVIAALRFRIKRLPWLDEGTRSKALEKLGALAYDVAYPRWLFNNTVLESKYEDMNITEDFAENVFATFEAMDRYELAKLRLVPDKLDWDMTPLTTNAYYDFTKNRIVIPIGAMLSPMYHDVVGLPPVLNYGAIAAVVAHEVTHGFDSIGRMFDKDGYLSEWWAVDTASKYRNRTKCLVDKFSQYEVGGLHLRGDQTLSENIADDGAVKIAFEAYRGAVSEGRVDDSAKVVGIDLTSDQLFFVSWAQMWCSLYSTEAMKSQILTNSHSPPKFRVLGPLSDSEDFAKAFNCKAGSFMNPADKCSVW